MSKALTVIILIYLGAAVCCRVQRDPKNNLKITKIAKPEIAAELANP